MSNNFRMTVPFGGRVGSRGHTFREENHGLSNDYRQRSWYDESMLQFLRENVYDGSIPKPQPTAEEDEGTPASAMLIVPHTSSNKLEPRAISGQEEDPEVAILNKERSSSHRTFRKKFHSKHILWPISTCTYSHTSNCFHNPFIQFSTGGFEKMRLITSPLTLADQDARRKAKMAVLRQEIRLRWDSRDWNEDLNQRLRGMGDELMTNRVAKRLFFRRCNGLYVNALGWEWSDSKTGTQPDKTDEKDKQVSGVGVNELSNNHCEDRISKPESNMTAKGPKQDPEDTVGEAPNRCAKRYESSRTTSTKQHKRTNQSPASCDRPSILNSATEPESTHETASSPFLPCSGTPQAALAREQMSPKIELSRLLARESLVQRYGTSPTPLATPPSLSPSTSNSTPASQPPTLIDAEDLAITCWIWNQRALNTHD